MFNLSFNDLYQFITVLFIWFKYFFIYALAGLSIITILFFIYISLSSHSKLLRNIHKIVQFLTF